MGLNSQNSPRVSILLPTHNRANVLPFAIRSVLAQTVRDFELLVVGDGCTDNSADVVQGFNDSRIHWFDLPKTPGFGYANRNIILQKARGEYIGFMAHDDLWLSDHLELLLPLFKDKNLEIVYSRPLWVIPVGMIVPGFFNLNHLQTRQAFLKKQANAIPASCVIYRRNCFQKYGYWNDKLPQSADWDMWIRIIKGGGEENFAYLGDSTCLHFKANWHDETYDETFGFRFWKRLFAFDQIPASLKVDVVCGEMEQEAVWGEMAAGPREWNKKIRTALQQTIDMCAFQGNLLANALISLNDEFIIESLPLHPSMSSDFLRFNGAVTQILMDLKSVQDIKNTLAWKIHEYIAKSYLVRNFYLKIVTLIKHSLSKIKKY